jgi:hypothetical protein
LVDYLLNRVKQLPIEFQNSFFQIDNKGHFIRIQNTKEYERIQMATILLFNIPSGTEGFINEWGFIDYRAKSLADGVISNNEFEEINSEVWMLVTAVWKIDVTSFSEEWIKRAEMFYKTNPPPY